MKLEPGQIWRRPDGTLWCVDSVDIRNCLMRGPLGDLEVLESLPVLVVTDTWTRTIHPETLKAYADLVGMNGLTKDAPIMGVNEDGQVVTNSLLMAAEFEAATKEDNDAVQK